MLASVDVLTCTNCGASLEELLKKLNHKQSTVTCKCGFMKEIRNSLIEDEKHLQYEYSGVDPLCTKDNLGIWRLRK